MEDFRLRIVEGIGIQARKEAKARKDLQRADGRRKLDFCSA
jgi:hypothetical protein